MDETRNIHKIYLKLGVIVSGTVDDIERFLVDLNSHKTLKVIYTTTSPYRLKIIEDKPKEDEVKQ
jgi:sRNA-binding regulator protein Hfq